MKKYLLFSVLFAALLIGITVGVTYAFFNYTRTGAANNLGTGPISFNAVEGNDTITLDNLFPITSTEPVTSSTPGAGSVSVHITGDTTYTRGIEYLVTAVNVTNTTSGSALPISTSITYTPSEGNGKTIGTPDDNYFTNRGSTTSVYKVLSSSTIAEGQRLLVGYIAPGETGIDGNLVITAWLDAENIAITDTYFGHTTATPAPTAPNDEFGTTTEWVDDRTVFTTEEWNALSSNGVSFQIKVEAQEGTWVTSN